MEQVAAERPLSQEQQLSQLQRLHNGAVDTTAVHVPLDPPQRQYPRSLTGWGRTNISSGTTNGENVKEDGDSRPICRDNIRGKCTRGSSCKYRHSDCVSHEEARLRNEHGSIETAADSRSPRVYTGIKVGDLQKRSLFTEHRSRSPCRKFQSGSCYRGSSCPHPHRGFTDYERPTYPYSKVYHGVGAAFTNPGSHEGNIDDKFETSQGCDSGNKENNLRPVSFSRKPRSRSPCRNFLRGKCHFGSSCKRLHLADGYKYKWSEERPFRIAASVNPSFGGSGVEISCWEQYESNHHNQFRTGTFPGVSKSGIVCQYFLRGSCNQGRSCVNVHPATVYERTRYDFSAQHHQRFVASSNFHHFDDGSLAGEVKIHGMQPGEHNLGRGNVVMNDVNCNEHHKSQLANEQLAYGRGSLNVTSRRWSSERPQSKPGSNVGHDQHRPEVCLKFTRGRCEHGEFCKYLHSYHEYASSVSKQNRRPQLEGSADPLSTGKAIKSVMTQVSHGQSSPGSGKMSSTDRIHAPADGSFGEETKTGSVNVAMKLNANQSSEELAVVGHEFETSAEGNEDIKLWARQVKRQRSRSRSPFSHEHNFRCRKLRRRDCQCGYPRRNCCHEAQIQCPDGLSCNSMDPSSHVEDESNVMVPRGHTVTPSHGIQYDQDESAANTLQPSDANGNDEAGLDIDHSMVDVSEDTPVTIQRALASDFKCSAEENLISPVNATIVLEKDEMAGESICVCHEGKEFVEKIQALKTYSRKKSKLQSSTYKCVLESLTDEATDSSSQRLPTNSSVVETSLDNQAVVSVSGVTDDLKTSVTESSASENVPMIEHPTKRKRNRVTIKKVQDDVVEASSAATSISRRKLLVLDVNGLLADIVGEYPDGYKPDTTVSAKGVFKRPFCDDFLRFCFERFDVGIWSSRTKKNVNRVVDFLLKKTRDQLLFCWDQSHCTGTGYKTVENRDKPLVLKELKKLWENRDNDLPWKKGFYNESNTVLLDDSPYKALRNPLFTAVFPFPYSYADEKDNALGPDGDLRSYLARLAEAENVQKFIRENPFGQRPITKTNLSWAFYAKIAGKEVREQENCSRVPDSS